MKTVEVPNTLAKERGMVLFDEDYRAHILTLNEKIQRERAEVVVLRRERDDLREALQSYRALDK